jgi:hypothetical protein
MTVLHVPLLSAVVRATGSLLSFASHTALEELSAPPATHRAETQASQARAQPVLRKKCIRTLTFASDADVNSHLPAAT